MVGISNNRRNTDEIAPRAINRGMEDERNEPRDWHAVEQRAAAAENMDHLNELPMNNDSVEDQLEQNAPGDIRSNRKAGTTEELFNLKSSQEEIFTICAKVEEESSKKPAEDGIRGIEKLMKKSFEALDVSE